MELVRLFLPIILILMSIAMICIAPWWLTRFAWWRCLMNWFENGRWSPCAHRTTVVQRCPGVTQDLPDLYALVCQECQTVFIQDTMENFQAFAARVPWWKRVVHRFR
jgi:hypothetical protein